MSRDDCAAAVIVAPSEPAPTAIVAVAVAGLAIAVLLELLLALLLFGGHFARRFGKHAGVMFSVLQEVFRSDTVVRQLCVTRKHLVFFDDLLRRATHLAFGAGAVEDAVDDVAEGARAVRL